MRPFQSQHECRSCMERLILQIAEASTDDPGLREKLLRDGAVLLDREFNLDCIPSHLTTAFLRHAKRMTGCENPFAERKAEEMKHGRNAFRCLQSSIAEAPLTELIRFAAVANCIDIFTSLDEIVKAVNGEFKWGVSELGKLEAFFKKPGAPFLYLADNAGEVYFDAPLFQAFNSVFRESHYVVKGKPAQNDVTREDLRSVGMLESFRSVITHGRDSVGMIPEELNGSFLPLYEKAGLILAKGMGHYETLSRTERHGRTLFLLKAKCKPVADSIGIEEGTYAAFIQ